MTPEALKYAVVGLAAVVVLLSLVLVVKSISKDGFSLKGERPLFRARSADENAREFKNDFVVGTVVVVILVVVTQCSN